MFRSVAAVEATLAVDAVERAYLAVAGHQVDAKRYAKPAAMHRTEDGRGIDDCAHCRFFLLVLPNRSLFSPLSGKDSEKARYCNKKKKDFRLHRVNCR